MAAPDPKPDRHEFGGRRVLVTAGTQGIGQAVVARLREGGARVLATARRPPADLADADLFIAADITTTEGCAAVADAVRQRLGGIDVIVHVVGGSSAPVGGFAVLDDGEWYRALELNSVPRGPAGSSVAAPDARSGLRRDHSYHLDPERLAAARSDPRLRSRESHARQLQQGSLQGSKPERCSSGPRFPRLGGDRSRRGPGERVG